MSTLPHDKRAMKRLAITGASVLATAIAATAVVAEFADQADKSPSSVATLSVEQTQTVDPYADSQRLGVLEEWTLSEWTDNAIDWKIPIDAPFETFPMNFVDNGTNGNVWLDCSEEQFAWLNTHAEPFDAFADQFSGKFSVTLRNTASDSGALPLGNLRFEGEEIDSTPWVYLECTNGGRGNLASGQPLLIDVSGREAVYGEPLNVAGDEVMPVGSPVTVNLAPGEIAELVLTRAENVDKQIEYQGRFLADVLDGSGETVVLADNVHFMRDRVPGFRIHYIGTENQPEGEAGELLCVRAIGEPNEFGNFTQWDKQTCSPEEVVAMLREAEESVQ